VTPLSTAKKEFLLDPSKLLLLFCRGSDFAGKSWGEDGSNERKGYRIRAARLFTHQKRFFPDS
jgi:hypothetical protein